ncbi:MAG: Gfo/Idh/MocA family oxidoreductase, partial [Rhodospirillaceae bacterium]
AIVGLGVMGRRMLANMAKTGAFDPVLAWDPSPEACQAARKLVPGLAITTDAMAMVRSAEVDLVYIATPPDLHRAYALAAATAGKPIYCEKPLGTDVSKSRRLVSEIEEMGAKAIVNFTLASAPAADAIAAALADGSIGTVEAVDIHLHFCRWPRDWQAPARWLLERAEGGFVRETFSHYAYLTRRLFGEIELKRAAVRYPADGISAETQALALMDCSGIPVSFEGGTGGIASSGSDRVEFTVWGTKRAYRLYDWNRLKSSDGSSWTEHLTDIPDTREAGYRATLANARRFCDGEAHGMPSFRDALRVQELVEAILASA